MKKSKNLVELLIIALSLLLLIAAIYFSFKVTAAQIAENEIFTSNILNFDSISTPVNYETRIAKGDNLFAKGEYTDAASEYASAINIQVKNAEAHAKLGATYLALNESDKAIENYARAVEISPEAQDYQTGYGIALLRNGQFEAARGILENVNDRTNEWKLYYGILQAYSGDFKAAEDSFEAASNVSGNFLAAFASYNDQKEGHDLYLRALITEALIDTAEYELADAFAQAILNEKSDYRDVWLLLGYAKLKSGDYQAAEDSFKQAKNLDSVKPETRYFLATAHYFQEEYEDAVREFELALLYGFEPEVEAYRKVAESQMLLGKHEDALAAYEYLVKLDHSDVTLFVKPIWIAIDILGDLERAKTLAEEAVSYFPSEAMSHNLLSWVYIEQNELSLAENEIEIALNIDGAFPSAHYNAGLIKEKQGDLEGAKKSYKNAYKLATADDPIAAMAAEKYNSLTLNQGSAS